MKLVTYKLSEYKTIVTDKPNFKEEGVTTNIVTPARLLEGGQPRPILYVYDNVADPAIASNCDFTMGNLLTNIIKSDKDSESIISGEDYHTTDIFKAIHLFNSLRIYAKVDKFTTYSKLADILTLTNLHPIAVNILSLRIGRDRLNEISSIINPTINTLIEAKEDKLVEQGAMLLETHIQKGSKIVFYTDSDGDGISCATIAKLYGTLYLKPFEILVNRRKYGNGINDDMLMKLINMKPGLIITADHGSSDYQNIRILRDNGIDVIVTDHHPFSDNPNANILINPQDKESTLPTFISGAFVLYLMIIKHYSMYHKNTLLMSRLFEIAGLSTISDMMNMSKEINRYMVKASLQYLPENQFVKAYMTDASVSELTMQTMNMGIIPMINSSNRLDAPDEGVIALEGLFPGNSVRLLTRLNNKRKAMQRAAMTHALENIYEEEFMVIAVAPPGTAGVIGILANNIGAIYNKPCFVFEDKVVDDDKPYSMKGSGRGIALNADLAGMGLNLDKVASNYDKPIGKIRGHFGACGGYIRSTMLKEFVKEGSDYFKSQVDKLIFHDSIDMEYPDTKELHSLYKEQKRLEPYGQGFPAPSARVKVKVDNYNYYDKSKTLMFTGFIDDTGEIIEFLAFFPTMALVEEVRKGSCTVIVTLQKSFRGGGLACICQSYKRQ